MRPYYFVLCLLLFPSLLHGDASRSDWIGNYSMNHDGHAGILRIFPAQCSTMPCPGLGLLYIDAHGASYSGTVSALDENGQHLAFTIRFADMAQRFDLYIFSFDKAKLAGTTIWGGRAFGVMALKINSQPSGMPATEHVKVATPLVSGSSGSSGGTPAGVSSRGMTPEGLIEVRYPDGTVRTKRIGACGENIRFPDGRVIPAQCTRMSVNPVFPPDPPTGSSAARWLSDQDQALLIILQGLLGGANSANFQNYVKNYENPPNPVIYQRVSFRTKAITEFVSVPK